MKLDDNLQKIADEAVENIKNAEDKSQAIVDAMNKISEVKHSELIAELKEQSQRAESDTQFAKSLGLRVLSKEETDFYEKFKDIKQAITTNQLDVIPTTIVDRTLEDVKKESGLLKLVKFAPADVKKWVVAEKSGVAVWGALTAAVQGELTGSINTLNVELAKLTAYLIIPKAIRELALPFVDKYFSAILKETITDGIETGFLVGNGKEAPIGIYKSISSSTDGVHNDKTVNTTLTCFTPKGLAPVKKHLNKNGKRAIDKIYLVCNPNDNADYVAPALFDAEGKLISSYKNLEVIETPNNPLGKAAFVLPGKYEMGFSGFNIKEYDQTKALDDADVVIAKVYANGRAVDDNSAYIFDVTKLEEYIQIIKTIEVVQGA